MTTTEAKITPTPKNVEQYKTAINAGQECIKAGLTKADAARKIFNLLHDESREIVIKAFIEGATVTEKGSPTYYYNISRQYKKNLRESKATPKTTKPKES